MAQTVTLSDRSLTNPDLNADQFEGNMVTGYSGVYTHAGGADTDVEVELIKLPPGRVRIYSLLSRIETTAMVATADFHLGTRAFTNEDGTAVAEDDNRFADNLDAGSALDQAWPLPAGIGITDLNSQEGITLYCLVDTANIEDGDTIEVTCVYSRV
jgi:hypothetical protein